MIIRLSIFTFLFFILGACNQSNTVQKEYLAASMQPQLKPVREVRKSEKELFLERLDIASNNLNTPPAWLRTICYKESENNGKADNSHSSATGIIQFVESTARRLGTTTAKIRRMSRCEQVPYAEAYFMEGIEEGGEYQSLTDMYLYCLLPCKRKHHNEPNYVLMQNGDPYYKGNSGLDIDKNGNVQVWEVTRRLQRK